MTEEEQVGDAAPVASGKFFFPNDAVYEGEYKELAADEDEAAEAEGEEEVEKQPTRLRHGTGTYTEMGNTYQGAWEEDKMTGQGKFSYASKAVYEGQWKENKYDGEGKYTWPDGSSYEVSACRSKRAPRKFERVGSSLGVCLTWDDSFLLQCVRVCVRAFRRVNGRKTQCTAKAYTQTPR